NGLLQLGGEKMSKSIGNLISISELIARKRTVAFRIAVLQSHYRVALTFTDEVLESGQRGLERIQAALDPERTSANSPALEPSLAEAHLTAMLTAMDQDFDTPRAMAEVFGLVRAINRSAGNAASGDALLAARATLSTMLEILGIDASLPTANDALSAAPFIDLLVSVRESLRSAKLWQLSDQIRDGLGELGITLADGPNGATWRSEETGQSPRETKINN
ncbi:MAG TPA: cysteine--tRNA ligase, partial [Thermomicrobiales bacterium]|nr:cysteine--tRNA ligase [Thermomicrobiales bacterium]